MSVYQTDPQRAPDSQFEPGCLAHLVAGNRGRLLDPRRTPVTVTGICTVTGTFRVRIDDFEDRGACWEVPVENLRHYQFARGGSTAAAETTEALRRAGERLDRPLHIQATTESRRATRARLRATRRDAARWLDDHGEFLADGGARPDPGQRRGDERLQRDLRRYLEARGLWAMDESLSRQYVSNPCSGELVKGYEIVLAEMGLVDFHGKVVRDPNLFEPPWDRPRRSEHVLARMGFVFAALAQAGQRRLTVFRGLSSAVLRPPLPRTFVSTTASREVAESHFEAAGPRSCGALARRAVPAGRIFMSYLETAAMNRQFLEAEVVVLHDPRDRWP